MKKAKTLLIFLTCLTASLVALTGCGGGGGSSSGDPSSATSSGGQSGGDETLCIVTFETNGGTAISSLALERGETIEKPADPTKEYFTFGGWYADAACTQEYTFGGAASGSVTVYAKWNPVHSVRIYFESNGGSAVETGISVIGGSVSEPADPVRTGYVFGGWYADAALERAFDFSSPAPDADITLYAKWDKDADYRYVTYVLNGETVSVQPVENGKTATAQDMQGLVSDGWHTDETLSSPYDFDTPVGADITLYASGYTEGLQFAGGAVTGYTGASETVVIPAVYGGEAVTSIADGAFRGNHSILEVVLPDTVTEVGEYAFYDCQYLVNIDLGPSVRSIGKYAFYRNERLESFGDLSGVSGIEEGTFLGCAQITSVSLSDGAEYVGDYAFSECAALAEISLPDSVQTIGDYAFAGCALIDSFYIPASLTSFGSGALLDCPISSVEVGEGNTSYTLTNGSLYADGGQTLVLYLPGEGETSYTTGTETKILAGAFAGGGALTSISIGNAVTEIERGALRGADNVQTLALPFLGDGEDNLFLAYAFGAPSAFSNGSKGVYVPASLRSVSIASPVAALPDYAFYGCTGLETITGIESAASYGDYAFAYTALQSFSVPAGVTSIGADAFTGCAALTEITVDAGNAEYASFDGCLYDKSLTSLKAVPMAKTEIQFAEEVETIEAYAFRGSAVEEVTVPDSVQTIGSAAFIGCRSLSYMSVPFIGGSRTENTFFLYIFGGSYSGLEFSGVENYPSTLTEVEYRGAADIPDFAFTYCTALNTLTYGEEVKGVGRYAFANTAFTTLPLGDGVTRLGDHALSNLSLLTEAVIPGRITEMGTNVLFAAVALETLTFEEGITSIPESFAAGYSQNVNTGTTANPVIETRYYSSLREINIPASVTSIGDYAFRYAGYNFDSSSGENEMNEVTVHFAAGSRLAEIGNGAFATSGVARLDLPASLRTVGQSSFENCPFLSEVNFGSAEEGSVLEEIGGIAFASCTQLSSFNIYKDVQSAADVPSIELYSEGNIARNCFYGSAIPAIGVYNPTLYTARSYWAEYADSIYELE